MPVVLALLSSLLWGLADFLGGMATKRLRATTVVGASQAIALVGLVPLAAVAGALAALGRPEFWHGALWPGVAAGVVGVVALASFYAALAQGTMGVVAPIAALGSVIPVAVGLAAGESPTPWQLAGIVVAIAGVVLASGPELSGGASPRPLLLASLAAVGFGSVAVLLARGTEAEGGGVLVTLVVMRTTSVLLLSAALLVSVLRRRQPERPARRDLLLLATIGIGDAGANACFALASRDDLLSVVGVLASLYPVVTVLLARQLLGERLRPVQGVGVVTALAGVGLLAVG